MLRSEIRQGHVGKEEAKLEAFLRIEDLVIQLGRGQTPRMLVDGASLSVGDGEVVGLVGESGSGKSLTALSTLGLCPVRPGIVGGRITVQGRTIMDLPRRGPTDRGDHRGDVREARVREDAARGVRGRQIGIIFQEPLSAFDPLQSVGWHLDRALRVHAGLTNQDERRAQALAWLQRVNLGDAASLLGAYPHELSGGMCQRVMIASVLAGRPSMIIADEATTALDAITEYELVRLLLDLNQKEGLTLLVITHNLALALMCCHRVYFMKAGAVVEEAAVTADRRGLSTNHPYAREMLGEMSVSLWAGEGA